MPPPKRVTRDLRSTRQEVEITQPKTGRSSQNILGKITPKLKHIADPLEVLTLKKSVSEASPDEPITYSKEKA